MRFIALLTSALCLDSCAQGRSGGIELGTRSNKAVEMSDGSVNSADKVQTASQTKVVKADPLSIEAELKNSQDETKIADKAAADAQAALDKAKEDKATEAQLAEFQKKLDEANRVAAESAKKTAELELQAKAAADKAAADKAAADKAAADAAALKKAQDAAAAAAAAGTPPPITTQKVAFQFQHNPAQCLDMQGDKTNNATGIQILGCNAGFQSQVFNLSKLANGAYVISRATYAGGSPNGFQCLHVANNSVTVGGNLETYHCDAGPFQQFTFANPASPTVPVVDLTGPLVIRNIQNGKCLSPLNGGTGDGVIVQQVDCQNVSSQTVIIQKR